jgi:hypothetical protein
MTNIYDLHNKAFASVSAFVILKDGERVATVAFKFPKDGAGRTWCYLHILGAEMTRGYATGYGYDKRSAAFLAAAKHKVDLTKSDAAHLVWLDIIPAAHRGGEGSDWQRALRDAGFTVLEAV